MSYRSPNSPHATQEGAGAQREEEPVFFIPSDSEEDEEAQVGGYPYSLGRRAPTRTMSYGLLGKSASAVSFSPTAPTSPPPPTLPPSSSALGGIEQGGTDGTQPPPLHTMQLSPPPPRQRTIEEVLFGETYPPLLEKSVAANAPVPSPSPTAGAAPSTAALTGQRHHSVGPVGHMAPMTEFSGDSAIALPKPRLAPMPRSLVELRGMTCSEVREYLEFFFASKERQELEFEKVQQVLKATPIPPVSSGAEGQGTHGATAVNEHQEAVEEGDRRLRRRDRCARLVNTSNWGTGEDDPMDVLLPAELVPDSNFYQSASPLPPTADSPVVASKAGANLGSDHVSFTTATAPAAAVTPSLLPATRPTLRTHQIAGIRFLWSVLVDGPVGQIPAVGCILAHTMGLGKTAQVVLFLHLFMAAFHRPSENAPQRVLVVVPKSTQPGWQKEMVTWSSCFPTQHRLHVTAIDETARPPQRVQLYQQWRRTGGVLLIGYEALVRLMQLVEEEIALSDVDQGTFTLGRGGHRHRGGGDATSTAASRALSRTRRLDEGGTTYGGAADPFTELVVCDEAHRLKSANLQVVTALRGLHPLRRLLLTGTPLQNHLEEYWAMVDFAMHKYFDRRRFRDYFIQPIESSVHRRASSSAVDLARKKTFTLINEVKHFVQRVDSSPLKAELPPLHEYVVVLPLSSLQKELYLRFLRVVQREQGDHFQFLPAVSYAGKIAAHPQLLFQLGDQRKAAASGSSPSTASSGPGARAGRGRRAPRRAGAARRVGGSGLESDDAAETSSSSSEDDDEDGGVSSPTAYRSFSRLFSSVQYDGLCDPPPDYAPKLEDGVKLNVSLAIIKAALMKGEKTLFFSLSTTLLDFFELLIAQVNVEDVANGTLARRIRYCRLDGSHSNAQRATMLREFDKETGPDLFLLSMKAGGVGVTITAATRVILVDTSFNPADDQQAIGRAFRYGQTRPVYVYRLLCYQTLEHSIFEQKLAKDWLFKTVVEESALKRDGLSGMHLREIFNLLGKAARALRQPPVITAKQRASTEAIAAEDDLFASAVASRVVYAQPYEGFLVQDEEEQYGEAERQFYKTYQRDRLFDVSEDGAAGGPHGAESELERRRRQRESQAEQLGLQSRTLMGMVDELIRSRAGTDAHLAHLLTVMGLQVDPATGMVRTTADLRRQEEEEAGNSVQPQSGERGVRKHRRSRSPARGSGEVYVDVGTAHPQREGRAQRRHRTDSRTGSPTSSLSSEGSFASSPTTSHSSGSAQRSSRRQAGTPAAATATAGEEWSTSLGQRRSQPVLLLDSDSETSNLVPPTPQPQPSGHGDMGSPTGPQPLVNPSTYAPHRPGKSASYAIEVDEDD